MLALAIASKCYTSDVNDVNNCILLCMMLWIVLNVQKTRPCAQYTHTVYAH